MVYARQWLTLQILSFLTIPLCFKISSMKKGSNGTKVSGRVEAEILPTYPFYTTSHAHTPTSPWPWEQRRKRIHSPSNHPLPCQRFRPSPPIPALNRESESQSSFSIHSARSQTPRGRNESRTLSANHEQMFWKVNMRVLFLHPG